MPSCKIIAICNQKGGVTKTTTTANLGIGLAMQGKKVLLVAASQIGNVGGEPYWSWYGFSSRAEWCACFVSWCAFISFLIKLLMQ
jgi:hypothetical protein